MQQPALLREVTPRLLRIYLFASIGAMNFGYNNNWWSGIITLPSFINAYGEKQGAGQHRVLPSSWLSAASGTPIAGWIIGCMIAGFLTRNIGRKMTIVVVCVVGIVGMVLQAAVENFWVLMIGRLINSFSMGIEANCVPMYMAELAPASVRGGLVGLYQSWLYVGAIISAATIYGASMNLQGMWSYKPVFIVQLVTPCLLLSAVWFIPESPRWLLSKGRKEEALKALVYMREGSRAEEAVSAELDLMDQAMQEEMENYHATSYFDCFRGSNMHRTIVAVGVQVLQQAQGNSFTTTYLVIFLKQIGLADPLLINIARMCVNLGACILTLYLSDKIGRRVMFMTGSFFMAVLMWIGAFAASCWGSVMWAVTSEVSTAQLREKTIAIATIIGFIVSLLITYINPFVQNEPGNLGSRVGMIYGSISLLAIAFVFFVVPELKGRSLEELDELFHARVPAWRASQYVSTGIGSRITGIEVGSEEVDNHTKKDVE